MHDHILLLLLHIFVIALQGRFWKTSDIMPRSFPKATEKRQYLFRHLNAQQPQQQCVVMH